MYQIETEVLWVKVLRALRTMIINGELRPGQKLIQEDLAEHLGVSRTPLLAAFSRLEQENLVVNIPRRGVYVKQYSDDELLDLCKIRIRLEPLGAREAATVRVQDLSRLSSILKNFDKAVKKKDASLIKQADFDFHVEILRICGNSFLHNMLLPHIITTITMSGLQMKYIEINQAEHHKILEAIRDKDPKRAESIMLKHTKRSCKYQIPEK